LDGKGRNLGMRDLGTRGNKGKEMAVNLGQRGGEKEGVYNSLLWSKLVGASKKASRETTLNDLEKEKEGGNKARCNARASLSTRSAGNEKGRPSNDTQGGGGTEQYVGQRKEQKTLSSKLPEGRGSIKSKKNWKKTQGGGWEEKDDLQM